MDIAKSGFFAGVNPGISIASIVSVLAAAAAGIFFLGGESEFLDNLRENTISDLKVYYLPVVSFFVVFALALMVTKYGSVKLGDDTDTPDFGYFAWFSMLFSAGMGIGLVFWSVAEPIYHFQGNPFLAEGQENTAEAAKVAMRLTFFHWGIHPWATYVIVGMTLAYFSYRRRLPLTFRSALTPIFGDKINGSLGSVVDVIIVFVTVIGVATSLGLGVQQLNTGMNELFGMPKSTLMQVVLVVVITAIATVSVVSGLARGIKYLSVVNIMISILALFLILLVGSTFELIKSYGLNLFDYLIKVAPLSIWIDDQEGRTWQAGWTTFYWAWWLTWAPFVGMFIARISRGRTIREFIFGALLVPTGIGFLWLTVFGNTALGIELNGPGGITEAVNEDVTLALYSTFDLMNLGSFKYVMAGLLSLLIFTYFITSADSGTLVVTTILAGGNPNPPVQHRVIWGLSEGVVAIALLIGGGLAAVQVAAVSVALPFSIIMLFMVAGLVKSLWTEER